MGSFSVSCAMTGVSLANQRAVLIPLAPSRYAPGGRRHPTTMGGSLVISNEGACALYGALTLPLIGRVGDYGDLEDLEEDVNTAFLRERLGGKESFEMFIQALTSGREDNFHPFIKKMARRINRRDRDNNKWDGKVSGCWVSREAWDEFSTHAWNESGKPRATVFDDGWLDPQNLKGMGFTKGKKDEETAKSIFGSGNHGGTRYNIPYTHPSLPELIVWCDGHMSSEASYRGTKVDVKYHFQDLQKAVAKLGMRLPYEMVAWAKATSIYRGHLLTAREKAKNGSAMDRKMAQVYKDDPQLHWNRLETYSGEKEAISAQVRARVQNRMKGTDLPVPELPPATEHVYCSWEGPHTRMKGEPLHVHLYGTGEGDAEDCTIVPCNCKEAVASRIYGPGMKFTRDVWDAVKAAGWTAPKQKYLLGDFSDDPYLRSFPRETFQIYRRRFLSAEFLPLVEALLTFEGNMYAANRLLAPTMSGWQCGNNATQRQVAKMALKVIKVREDRWKR